jgi:hypothetical protein
MPRGLTVTSDSWEHDAVGWFNTLAGTDSRVHIWPGLEKMSIDVLLVGSRTEVLISRGEQLGTADGKLKKVDGGNIDSDPVGAESRKSAY